MRVLSLCLPLVTFATPLLAESLFDGRWRPDASTMKSDAKPTVILLQGGVFGRDSKKPEDQVKADGVFHSAPGGGYVDEVAMTVIGDRAVREVDKLRGKIVYTIDYALSADGRLLTWNIVSFANPAGAPVRSQTRQRRVGVGPPNAHAISGSWQQVSIEVEPGTRDQILKLDGNRFSSWTPQGAGYEAIIGGPPVPIVGDGAGGMASVTMPRPDTIVESDSIDGVVGDVLEMTVLPDGTTIRAVARSPQRNESSIFYLHKQ